MKLLGIAQARTVGFVELNELNPRGRVFFPDLVKEIVHRYDFQKFPQTAEDFNEQKGIEFFLGRIGDTAIDKFTIFKTVLAIETRSNTTDSQHILQGMLEWGKEKLGLTYSPDMLKWAYVSGLLFQTDIPLIRLSSDPLAKLAAKTGKAVSEIWGEPLVYEPSLLSVSHDPGKRNFTIAALQIEYLKDHSYSENKYYSQAPLPTDVHIDFLKEFEADVLAEGRSTFTGGVSRIFTEYKET